MFSNNVKVVMLDRDCQVSSYRKSLSNLKHLLDKAHIFVLLLNHISCAYLERA